MVAGSAFLLLSAVRFGDWIFLAMALPIALPAMLLPWMLAVRIERVDPDPRSARLDPRTREASRLRRSLRGHPRSRRLRRGLQDPPDAVGSPGLDAAGAVKLGP